MSFETAIDLSRGVELATGELHFTDAPYYMQGNGVEPNFDLKLASGQKSYFGETVLSGSKVITQQDVIVADDFHLVNQTYYGMGNAYGFTVFSDREDGDDTVQFLVRIDKGYIVDIPYAPKIYPDSEGNVSWIRISKEQMGLGRAINMHNYVKGVH